MHVVPRAHRLSLHDHSSEVGVDKWIHELGCTNAPAPRGNVRTALRFFADHVPRLPIADAVSFLAAMDVSRPVRQVSLRPGERLIGFRTPTQSPFKLFFARRGASMHISGINSTARGPVHFAARAPVQALESTTTGAVDTWSARRPR